MILITGMWNLWDSRSDPAGRTRRTLHTITMLACCHRKLALGSVGVATLGTAMMWLWKN